MKKETFIVSKEQITNESTRIIKCPDKIPDKKLKKIKEEIF